VTHDSTRPMQQTMERSLSTVNRALASMSPRLQVEEIGRVMSIGHAVARVRGLPGVGSEETVLFPGGKMGMAFNLDVDEVGVILLDHTEGLAAGTEVRRGKQVLDVPVGRELLGRVVDGVGRPLDGRGPVAARERRPVESEAPAIMDRLPVTVPLQTGLKVIDALIPVGRGQRQLILGDRQTGKTAVALDAILNQKGKNVICAYCATGQRAAAIGRVIAELRERGSMDYSFVVASTEDDPPGLQFITPYAAMSMAEFFMHQGHDVLLVLDDLTRHARAYRELSLLLRRPPGREAFPGDIFFIHSRLLERSTHLRKELGGGSLTALPICETEAQNLSAYIPTNLISITDGQIYLSPDLFQKGVLPPVDVGKSVSRVGGKTQLAAYRNLASAVRLSYAQFEELEIFSRFGTRLDVETRKALDHGLRVREILKQKQYEPFSVAEQIAVLVAVNAGMLDQVPLDRVAEIEKLICQKVIEEMPRYAARTEAGEALDEKDGQRIVELARAVIDKHLEIESDHANAGITEAKNQGR
jgi:F-type H+-transporting ATPase subunit alpha